MFENCKNSKKQGDLGLGKAIGWLTECGYTVSIPLTDSQDYDLIVDMDNKLNKVQVKTTRYKNKNGIFCVNLSVKGGNQSSNTIKKFDANFTDYVYVYTSNNEMYFIPSCEIKTKNNLNIGKLFSKYKIMTS
jgi:hypothetical protein